MKANNKIAVFIPTYKRPGDLQRVATNLEQNTWNKYRLYFGVELGDTPSFEAALATGAQVLYNRYEPGYSNTIQSLYEASKEPFIIHANDDFDFHKHWDKVPISMFMRTGLMVVGLKQTEGDTHGSAISIFRRSYIEERSGVIDMPNRVFYPYNHNYIDTEFTATAQHRGVWAKCEPRVITHMHPGFTGQPKDETYLKNEATASLDQQTFDSRRHLWGG